MRAVAIVAMAAAAFTAAAPAHAAASFVAAAPGSSASGLFATQAVAVIAGDPITLVNADISQHGVRSEAVGSDEQSWCGPLNPGPEGPTNPRRYARGVCPLFWSDRAAALGGTRPVLGAELLQAGRAYAFRCTVFESMRAVIITT